MESRFGHDFGNVRVHTDQRAHACISEFKSGLREGEKTARDVRDTGTDPDKADKPS
jgi:hypothetical protein